MAKSIGDTLKNMPTKQKIMSVVIIAVLAVVIWQIIGMFGNNIPTEEAASAPTPSKVAQASPATMTSGAPTAQAGSGSGSGQNAMPATRPPVQDAKTPEMLAAQAAQREEQDRYLGALNKLQMLRVEREIAETNQAISKAKLETVTAEKGVSDLLANKPSTAQQVPTSAYASQLAAGVPVPAAPGSATPSAPAAAPADAAPSDAQYVVISVSMQFNKWTAVIGYKGQLYTVSIGDKLPEDGSMVADINKSGVVLKKDGERRKVSLLSTL